ncbi:MAG: N-acetylmuramic acid 6-phosphate etherase [Saprospiraceae bacterium]|nr:N-acetylmuramic acid 6-phosphate etherase [Saprospiraceae bacterium]
MFHRTTEQESLYDGLEKKSTRELLTDINREDQKVALAVQDCIPQIEEVVNAVYVRMKEGGRLFYIGAGTSGRLGILDASECPPTYGVPFDWVIGLIAGGDSAIRKAVEKAEDSHEAAWQDLMDYGINTADMVIGIAASGTTPYVLHGLRKCNEQGIMTACICCNSGSPVAKEAQLPIECVVGPEYVTGSTRMKAGTAQKLILNMISTSVMIKLGRVKGNRMVNMQLTNEKLVNRGVEMVMLLSGVDREEASRLLSVHGSVKEAVANAK